jgi:dTDP-glucose 4,6-dehydratase
VDLISDSASWVVRHLTLTYPKQYHIVSFDKIDYCASLNNTKCLDSCSNFSFVYGDINDQAAVLRCMRQYNIDTVMHFAAMSHVDLSFGNSFAFTETNVVGTHKLLEAAVKCGIKKFIHVSTDEVNGENKNTTAMTEDSLLKPTNPYAASKAAAEMYVEAYSKSYKLPCIIVRSNNVYGPHQYPESKSCRHCHSSLFTDHSTEIIPKFISLLDRQRKLLIHGSGSQRRHYLFGADAADAFDTILHNGVPGEIYNVESEDETTNIGMAHMLLNHFGMPEDQHANWLTHTVDRPFNDDRYWLSAKKLKALGWEQKVRLEEGLKITVDWYRSYGRHWWKGTEGLFESAFPEVGGEGLIGHGGARTPLLEVAMEKLDKSKGAYQGITVSADATAEGEAGGAIKGGFLAVPFPAGAGLVASTAAAMNAAGSTTAPVGAEKKASRKRQREADSGDEKENRDLDGSKRQMLGEAFGTEETVR